VTAHTRVCVVTPALVTCYLRLTTPWYLLLATCHLLFATCFALLIVHYLLFIVHRRRLDGTLATLAQGFQRALAILLQALVNPHAQRIARPSRKVLRWGKLPQRCDI